MAHKVLNGGLGQEPKEPTEVQPSAEFYLARTSVLISDTKDLSLQLTFKLLQARISDFKKNRS